MRLAIVGSRTFNDWNLFLESIKIYKPTRIISGGAIGADALAKRFAELNNLPLKEYLPEYDKYPPKIAPIKRNKLIVKNSDFVLAFWDGVSHGTKSSIDFAKQFKINYKIVYFP